MRYLAVLIIMMVSLQLSAQNEAGVMMGTSKLTSRISSVNVYGAFNGSIYYSRQFNFPDGVGLKPAIVIYSDKYMMNGMFVSDSANSDFTTTPANYEGPYISVTGIRIPVVFTYKLLESNKGGWATISSGIYMDHIIEARQKYMVGNKDMSRLAPLDNKFNVGLNEEMSVSVPVTAEGANSFVLSCGLLYQLTEYLEYADSFKPLQFYCKIGFTF